MTDRQKDDPLLDEARALEARARESAEAPLPESPSWFARLPAPVRIPIRLVGNAASLVAGALAWGLFKREDGQVVLSPNGRRKPSPSRFLVFLAGLFAAALLLHILASAIYYYATAFTETVYVTGKQEIETGEIYQFGGCTALPCSTESDNGKFYLIEASLYFPVLFYPEEEVFANIPQQNAACTVHGYGLYMRSLRWLYKRAQLYQHAVGVSCRPYTAQEIEHSVGSGTIVDESG